ncbi:MAG: cobalamin-binding protein [Bacillus sp. (in: Bacteria)]|nr:cobalamin-binding protein [Bacillus sp. (in: firmicutes)]
MRIVSLCPSNTELVAYLGLIDNVVGVDDYSDWPEKVNDMPKLGPDLSIDMDKVEELNPDLVLASLTVPGMEKNVEELQRRNIKHFVVPNPTTLSSIGEQLLVLGEITNTLNRGKELADKFHCIVDAYSQLSKKVVNKKTVYWEWWPKPIFTPGKDNWLTEMSEFAGGINIFKDYEEASVQCNWETVRKRNPDVINLVWVGVEKEKINANVVMKRPGWLEMEAIKNNELYILEEPYYCRPSPRLLIGLTKLGYLLHPDLYPFYREGRDPLLDI